MAEMTTSSSFSEDPENEIKNCMDSYSRILDVWKVMNDNYFKRVQLFMGIIQVGLFLAALKLLSSTPILIGAVLLAVLLGILGIMSAFMWMSLNKKQAQYLEFCRRSLRNIESRFAQLKIPLQYFTLESLVFNGHRNHNALYSAEVSIDDPKASEKKCWTKFRWSKERYPESDDNVSKLHTMKAVSGGMVFFEKYIAKSALVVWLLIIFVAMFLGYSNLTCFQTVQKTNKVSIERPNKANSAEVKGRAAD